MRRKWTAILLCAVLAAQPVTMVGAEALLSSEPEAELSDGGEAAATPAAEAPDIAAAPAAEGTLAETGECGAQGDNVTWKFDATSGVLTISGTGEMKDYIGAGSDFLKRNEIKKVVIKDGVTSIGNNAFWSNMGISSVEIPKSVTRIGTYAFDSCWNLDFLIVPDKVEEIGSAAFPSDVKLHGAENSAAQKYAEENHLTFTKHDWDEWIIDKQATCSVEGVKIRKCKVEGCLGTDSETYLEEHEWEEEKNIIQEPTCTEWGTKGIHCKNCTAIKEHTVDPVPPSEHKWKIVEEKPATCTENGYINWKCETCPKRKTEILNAGHNWSSTYTTDKAATCVTEGKRSIHCKNCNAIKPDSQTTIPAKGHLWDDGVITKYPTCTQTGIRTCTCERCKWTLRKEVTPTGHTYEGKITKATFEKDGVVSGVCKDCGHKVDKEAIPQVTTAELSSTEYTYNGTNRQPKVILKDRTGKELKPEDYSVTYPEESKRPGTYKLTITLKGDSYEGTLTKEYTVKKGNQVIGLEDATKRIDSKTVTLKAQILQGNKTGKFSYKSSNPEVATVTSWGKVTFHKVGKVEITATTKGSANYNSAQKTITLTIAPVPTAITKLQSETPGWLNIQYRANPDADGYQIQYGTSPDMYDAKYAAVNNAAIRSYTRKDVESGAAYYVRVRTYKVVDGERIYSNWSSIKSADVK